VNIADVLPDGVGGPLIPVRRLVGLLGGEDFDEAFGEWIELVGIGNMAMQANREILREDVDAIAIAVDAVADRYIDESILAADRHRGLGAKHGERIKAGAASAAKDEAQDIAMHIRTCWAGEIWGIWFRTW
jgi:hypothetical protein